MKSQARILDATAGYRMMWDTKESRAILWIDVEPEIELKPDIVMDCSNTDFTDGRFHTIFFDPPHSFGRTKNTGKFQTPSKKTQIEKGWSFGGYYGFDKYATKASLLGFINRSQKEFQRILSDDGILWFKWAEIHATWGSIRPIFKDWNVMMKFEIAFQGKVKTRTWWVSLMKKSEFC